MHNVDIFRKTHISIKLISFSLVDFSSDWTGKVNWRWNTETALGLYVAVIFVVLFFFCTCIAFVPYDLYSYVVSFFYYRSFACWLVTLINKNWTEWNWTELNRIICLTAFFVQNWPHVYLKQKHAKNSRPVTKCFYLIINLFTTNVCLTPLLFSNVPLNMGNHEERHDSPRSCRDALSKKCYGIHKTV